MKKIIQTKAVYILGTFISWILWGMFLPDIQEFSCVVENPFVKTSLRIRLCYFYLGVLDKETRRSFLKEAELCKNLLCVNRVMTRYLVQSMIILGDKYLVAEEKVKEIFQVREGVCLDEWGNPLQVAVVGGPVDFQIFPKELRALDVAIWSCGPNGVNEWGHGDDIFLKKPLFWMRNREKSEGYE